MNKINPTLSIRSNTRKCVAAESESPIPLQSAMYAARHIGHFGSIARIAPGMVDKNAFQMIHFQGATDALRGLSRAHHEVLDKELAPTLEKIGQCYLPFRCVEDIFLLDLHPRQRAAFGAQLVA